MGKWILISIDSKLLSCSLVCNFVSIPRSIRRANYKSPFAVIWFALCELIFINIISLYYGDRDRKQFLHRK